MINGIHKNNDCTTVELFTVFVVSLFTIQQDFLKYVLEAYTSGKF